MILALYVDNGIVLCKSIKDLNFIKEKLATEFKVKLYNNFESLLGINITIENNKLKLDQANYYILKNF